MQTLHGQVALVTGGARGIGYGAAQVLHAEGAAVVIADIDGEAARQAADQLDPDGRTVLAVATDVRSRASMQAAVAATVDRFGRLDILVANTGVYPPAALADIDDELWGRVMEINVRGALYALQACLPHLTSQGYGRVILMSSITGSVVGQPGYALYGASKAALIGLMRSAALEVAGANITINAVLPGNIATPGFHDQPATHQQGMLDAVPVGRLGTPADVGWAVRYLASPEASYITGQTLVVDGGQTLPENADGVLPIPPRA